MEITMKFGSLLLGVSISLAPLAGVAQQPQPTPAQIAEHEVQRATALFSLTTDQQTAALAILTAEATSAATLQQSSRSLDKALDTAITSGEASAITTTAASLGTVDGELTALHATAEAKFYQILTSEQQAKFVALQEAQIGVGGPGGPGGAGGPGGPPQ
jgi:Spy/CpxP family protein refolding chaperone